MAALNVALALLACAAAAAAPPQLQSLSGGIAPGPDGNVWFTENGGVGRVTPQGDIKTFPAPPYSGGITSGPDHAIWFTASGAAGFPAAGMPAVAPAIVRITPAGQETQFTNGLRLNSSPEGIALGSDGNLWFAENGTFVDRSNQGIGRITPAGEVTEFTAGLSPDAGPRGITAGSDGNLWFTEDAGRIGRITPGGAVTEFSTGLPADTQHALEGITRGPDGNVWFTTPTAIGRMAPNGRVSLFTHGVKLSELGGINPIAPGPDNALWFTASDGVGRIALDGTVTRPRGHRRGRRPKRSGQRRVPRGAPIPPGFTSDSFIGITGANGALWVVEEGGSGTHIAKLTTHGQVSEFPPAVCAVPDVRNFHLAHARLLLADGGCGASISGTAGARGVPRTRLVVLAQRPAAGRKRGFLSKVTLKLGRSPIPARRCRLPRGRVQRLPASKGVLAYKFEGDDPEGEARDTTQFIYACVRPRGHVHVAFGGYSNLESSDEAASVTAAGHFLAYAETSADHYNHSDTTLRVYDITAARTVFSVRVEEHGGGQPPNTYSTFSSLALSANGFLAWATTANGVQTLSVHDSRGTRAIDSGVIAGVAFNGKTLSWTNAGQPRSAPLS